MRARLHIFPPAQSISFQPVLNLSCAVLQKFPTSQLHHILAHQSLLSISLSTSYSDSLGHKQTGWTDWLSVSIIHPAAFLTRCGLLLNKGFLLTDSLLVPCSRPTPFGLCWARVFFFLHNIMDCFIDTLTFVFASLSCYYLMVYLCISVLSQSQSLFVELASFNFGCVFRCFSQVR